MQLVGSDKIGLHGMHFDLKIKERLGIAPLVSQFDLGQVIWSNQEGSGNRIKYWAGHLAQIIGQVGLLIARKWFSKRSFLIGTEESILD